MFFMLFYFPFYNPQVLKLNAKKENRRWHLGPKPPYLCNRTHAVLRLIAESIDDEEGEDDDGAPASGKGESKSSPKQKRYESILRDESPVSPSSRAMMVVLARRIFMQCNERANTIWKAIGQQPAPWEIFKPGSHGLTAELIACGDHVAVGLLRERWKQITNMVGTCLGIWIGLDNEHGRVDGENDAAKERRIQINEIYMLLFEGCELL